MPFARVEDILTPRLSDNFKPGDDEDGPVHGCKTTTSRT